jgi:hypothetical protein
MNLVQTLCGMGKYSEARAEVMRVLQFNPDMGEAKQLLGELDETPPQCRR